jgi:glycosyltransferase involved in cell wall biosynthesis
VSPELSPDVSVVVPIYNEEKILRTAIVELLRSLKASGWRHEVILAENGSTDDTIAIAEDLSRTHREVRLLSIGAPNYGRALRRGILASQGKVVICEEIDLCDAHFHRVAFQNLADPETDMIVGSKLVAGADDRRPLFRHIASLIYTLALRILLGFPGTDTHGLKAFKRKRLAEIVDACVIEKDVFASELVIRAHRAGLTVRELPVGISEKRPQSINLLKRVPNVLTNLAKLTWVIRFARPRRPTADAVVL